MNSIAEERTLAEDHAERARFGLDAYAACVSADVEHRDVAGTRRGRIDDAAGAGVNAVGPDQEVPLCLGTVLEPRHDDSVRRGVSIHKPLAVLDAGSTPDRLVAQRPVEVGPLRVRLTVPSGRVPPLGTSPRCLPVPLWIVIRGVGKPSESTTWWAWIVRRASRPLLEKVRNAPASSAPPAYAS